MVEQAWICLQQYQNLHVIAELELHIILCGMIIIARGVTMDQRTIDIIIIYLIHAVHSCFHVLFMWSSLRLASIIQNVMTGDTSI